MARDIMNQATNKINVVGKLLDAVINDGVLGDGRKYKRANVTVRVTQTFGGREETSEVPVSMFASQYTKENKPNPGYQQIMSLSEMKTAQNVGIDNADTVRISGANIRENNFVSRNSGQLINGWQIGTSFISTGGKVDVASFLIDIYIMDMHPELDREGDETGRLVIKGAIVQYQGKLDVLEFIVENPDTADYIERNWEIGKTVQVKGRIRVTSTEEKPVVTESSWGEDIPETSTRTVRELIITKGSDEPFEDEFAYDTADIKKAFNVRKALIEQLQIDAKKGNAPKAAKEATPAKTEKKWDWE